MVMAQAELDGQRMIAEFPSEERVICIRNVSKSYPDLPTIADFSLEMHRGEFVAILGPSGCGKSTLLSLLAGLEQPDSGELEVMGGQAKAGQAALMPQVDCLLPWRRLLDNVALGAEAKGIMRQEARKRAFRLLEQFGLADFASCFPAQLSGGMRQRAALLRTLVSDSDVLLLDEPFGALDVMTREGLWGWLDGVVQEFKKSVILVTHSVEEALFLADRVVILSHRPARILHEIRTPFGHPRELELRTAGAFVQLKSAALGVLRGQGDL